jgi:hypothetical protein
MKQLKTKRLVKFEGRCSSWSNNDEHNRQCRVAKNLEAAGLGHFVQTNELAPLLPSDDPEKAKRAECTYYDSEGPVLVTDAEFQALKKAGVSPTVIGIYEDERTRYSDIVFYGGCALFVFWNIVGLLKFAGVI